MRPGNLAKHLIEMIYLLCYFIISRALFRIKGSKIWNFPCSLWYIMQFLRDREKCWNTLNLKYYGQMHKPL